MERSQSDFDLILYIKVFDTTTFLSLLLKLFSCPLLLFDYLSTSDLSLHIEMDRSQSNPFYFSFLPLMNRNNSGSPREVKEMPKPFDLFLLYEAMRRSLINTPPPPPTALQARTQEGVNYQLATK